jgi:hypothetical protein
VADAVVGAVVSAAAVLAGEVVVAVSAVSVEVVVSEVAAVARAGEVTWHR